MSFWWDRVTFTWSQRKGVSLTPNTPRYWVDRYVWDSYSLIEAMFLASMAWYDCSISFILVAYAKCPDRQIGTTLKYNNQCLEFIRDQYYQPEALQQCQQYGGHLVTIESREKQVGSNHRVDIKLDSKDTEDDFCQPHAAMYLQLFHAMGKTCSVIWLQ